MISTTSVVPIAIATTPATTAIGRYHFGGGATRSFSISPLATSRSYSAPRSSLNSSSRQPTGEHHVIHGNFSSRRWALKKWIVKMKPIASIAS